MNRQQTILISIFVGLFFAMYFGCDYVPKNHKKVAEQRTLSKESADVTTLVADAKNKLSAEQKSTIDVIENQLRTAADNDKLELTKKLSGAWYRLQNSMVSGYYAEQVATTENTEQAWMITGSMYMEGIQQNEEANVRQMCTDKAVKAFENAISINPSNLENKINLALCYTENPPQDNPMKGILMLRELDSKNPEEPKILFQLARMAMRTNQHAKAIERLEQILKKDAQNPSAICLIADAYRAAGDETKANTFAKKCERLMTH